MSKRLVFALMLAFWAAAGEMNAQQAEVGLKLEVDQRQVEVGDKLTVTVEFKQIGSGIQSMGQPELATSEHFERSGPTSSSAQVVIANQQTATISTTRLTLVATKAGDDTIGPAVLIYEDPQLGRREIKSNIATVQVVEKKGFSLFGRKKERKAPAPPMSNPNPPAAAGNSDESLRDLKPLIPESPWAYLLRPLVWLAVLCLSGFLIWRFFFKKKGKGTRIQPGEEARLREAWKKLADEDLGGKEFCLALSSLVRECLQFRFSFPAVDYTTEEILAEIPKVRMTDDEKTAAEKCLKACDRVLYADGNVGSKENLRGLCASLLPKTGRK
jgi:hypothetical protein